MKHLIPLLLALLAPLLPVGAQRMVWTSPLQGDIPCIEGRAWNIETGKNFQRLPARFETTLPANVWELSKQGAGLSISFVTTARNISVRYGLSLHSDGLIDGVYQFLSLKYFFKSAESNMYPCLANISLIAS